MRFSYKNTALSVIVFTLIITSMLLLIAYRTPETAADPSYVLKEYNGTVALYKDGKITTVFDEIVLTSLPHSDRKRFADGIKVKDEEEAIKVIEDYDG